MMRETYSDIYPTEWVKRCRGYPKEWVHRGHRKSWYSNYKNNIPLKDWIQRGHMYPKGWVHRGHKKVGISTIKKCALTMARVGILQQYLPTLILIINVIICAGWIIKKYFLKHIFSNFRKICYLFNIFKYILNIRY